MIAVARVGSRIRAHRIAALSCVAVLACVRSEPRPASRPAGATSADREVRSLVLHAASSGALCSKLRDKFIALPAPGGASGVESGLTPAVGRWWIRSCDARQVGEELRLALAGPGWFWVHRSHSGFEVKQYVYFNAVASQSGALDFAYDAAAKLASVWFTPSTSNVVRVEPVGRINARAETFWASLFDTLTLGTVVSGEVRATVAAEGTREFQDRLAGGLTLTYDLGREQADVVVGQLPKGLAPRRPFTDNEAWWVNERLALYPGGVQVLGPFPTGPAVVDLAVESGPGVAYRAVCALDLQRSLDRGSLGSGVQLAAAAVLRSGTTTRPQQVVQLATIPCSWYWVVSTKGSAESVAAARVRSSTGASAGASAQGAVVKLLLVSYRIEPLDPRGEAWDAAGGAPDPSVRLIHGRTRYVLAGQSSDTLEKTVLAAGREPLEVSAGEPIVLEVVDEDLVSDDLIGRAEITLEDVKQGPELVKTLSVGDKRTGEVRVRVEVLTWE